MIPREYPTSAALFLEALGQLFQFRVELIFFQIIFFNHPSIEDRSYELNCLKHKNDLSTFCRLAISEVLLVATAWLPAP